ncbi:hypothetical protein A7X12_08180 [Sphingomonas sp. TDK1]|nr:hypothetical protein A7X12_08180 [Sphingomonas sp. TDK1]
MGGIGGLFYFAGWSYEQAYYMRFAIDPSIISTSSLTLALDGVRALIFSIATMAPWMMIGAVLLMLLAVSAEWLDRRYFPARSTRNLTSFGITLFLSLLGITGLMLLLGSNSAGARTAGDRIRNVREGNVWNYHLDSETLSGVAIGQNAQASWILTKAGVRQIKTDAIRTIDGPLLKRVAESAGQLEKH